MGETILSNIEPALRRTWLPVARSDAVGGTPARTWLLGEPLVLVRVADEVVVLEDRCPHRFAPLSAGKVVDGMLECAYHGWRYDSSGRCAAIPSLAEGASVPRKARCGRPYAVTERYGLVFVALGEPLVELPEIPAFSEENRVRVDLTPFTGRYGAAQLIDNQLDVSHFAFLHRSPFFVELELEYPVMGGSNVILFFVQPETADRATMYVTMLFEQPGGFSEDELAARVAFEYRVVGEDLALQERFDELALPLDPTVECHVRADRPALEYRRLLADLVRAGAD